VSTNGNKNGLEMRERRKEIKRENRVIGVDKEREGERKRERERERERGRERE
jgi:hypothetical protein